VIGPFSQALAVDKALWLVGLVASEKENGRPDAGAVPWSGHRRCNPTGRAI